MSATCCLTSLNILSEGEELLLGQLRRQSFLKKTIQLLRARAGEVCSNPDCRIHTAGSGSQGGKIISIGVAAHICAASPGGARYYSEMSECERKSYDNGIWLCQSCSRLIDVDEARFTVELLKQWKLQAERYSLCRVGQKAITQRDHDNEVQKAYGKGVAAQPNSGVSSMCNVLVGYEQSLSELDDRFMISVEHVSTSKAVHRIEPKPGHDPSVNLLVRDTSATREKFQRLQEFGESITLDGDSFKFEGSKLFETLINAHHSQGYLTVGAIRQKIETYLILRSDLLGDYELACFDSYMTVGSKGLAIKGKGLAGLFTLDATVAEEFGAKVNVRYSVKSWLGQRLNKLSYFPKLLKARDFLTKDSGTRLVIECYYEGNPLFFDSLKHQYKTFIQGFTEIITIVNYCRKIAENFSESLIFKEYSVNDADYERIKFYSQILSESCPTSSEEGYQFCEGNFVEGMETSIDYWQAAGTGRMTYEEQSSCVVTNVLGNRVIAPLMNIVVHRFSLASFCRLDAKHSGQVSFIVTAVKGSTYESFFDKNGKWVLQ
jgi:hypothetical protein